MRNIRGRTSLVALILLLTIGSMVACNNKNNSAERSSQPQESAAGTASSSAKTDDVVKSPKNNGKYEPPVTITTVMPIGDDIKFRSGETIDNNVMMNWFRDNKGINIKVLWTTKTVDDYKNKQKLMFASNEDIPDVMIVNDPSILANFIEAGVLKDISEDFKNYASKRFQDSYATQPSIWNSVLRGDKKYGLPLPGDGMAKGAQFFRQDWLDKFGLKAPATIAELENIMDAFVNKDPDGNGKKDTIGMNLSLNNHYGPSSDWMATADFVFGAYGQYLPHLWSQADDGSLVYGSIQPSVKEALGKLAEWFKKGYLDKEIGSMAEDKAMESFAQNKSGIAEGPDYIPYWPIADYELRKTIPGIQVKAYPVPAGPKGHKGTMGSSYANGWVMVFRKDFDHMDAIFDYLDTAMMPYGDDSPFKNGYFEGYDYVLKDGKPNFNKDDIPGGKIDPQKYLLTWNRLELLPANSNLIAMKNVLAGKTPSTPLEEKFKSTLATDRNQYEAAVIEEEEAKYAIRDEYMGPPTPTMQTRKDLLDKMESETFTKIIYGKLPIDSFDKFVADWRASGGDQITKEVNDWWNQVKGK